MREATVQHGSPAPTPAISRGRFLVMALGYGVAVAFSACLISLAAVILAGPFIGAGDRFELSGLQWLVAQPIVAVPATASMALCRYYRARETWLATTTFFLANSITVAAAALLPARVVP